MKKFILYLAAAFCFLLVSKSASAQFGRPNLGNTPAADTLYLDTTYTTGVNAFAPTNSGGAVNANGWTINGSTATPASLSAIGLTFNASTGELLGTPTALLAGTTFTYTATNGFGTSNPVNVVISVIALPPPAISYTTPDSYLVGVAVSLSPTNSDPGITTSYSEVGTLPAGLSFNTATGVISGTTTTITATVTIDVYAHTSFSVSGTQVTITVTANPPIISYPASPEVLTQGTAMTALTPTNTGGTVATAGAVYGAGTTIVSGLSGAYGMTTDASGNIYVANSTGNSVTEYSTTGVTTTTAVATNSTPVGIVFDAAGDAFVLEQATNSVVEYVGGLAGTATTIITGLSTPTGIAIDASGNLYIANSGNNTITKYTVTTWALALTITANTGGFFNRRAVSGGIAVDASGNIYVVDNGAFGGRFGSEVDVYSSAGVYLRRYRQGRTNSAIAVDASGNIYLTSTGRQTATVYTSNFAAVTATEGGFSSPRGITYDAAGNLYVSDYTKGTVTKYPRVIGYVLTGTLPPGLSFNTTTGVISGTPQTTFPATTYTVTAYNAGGSGSTTFTISCLGNPPVISYTTPDVYGIGAVISLSPTLSGGALIPTGYGTGTALTGATLSAPWGMTKDASGNIWVVNSGNNTVSEFGPTGAFIKNVTITGTAGTLTGIAIDAAGNMYFSSTNGRVYKATAAGAGAQYANPGFGASLYGIAIDASGVVYVTDEAGGNVYKITAANTVTRPIVKPTGGITNPTGIAVDAAGDIYVLDATSKTLVEYNAAGAYVRTIATGLTQPFGLYLDASGDAYVSDNSDGTVKVFNSNGTLVATLTGIAGQRGLTVDSSGNLYVSDFTSGSVTKYPGTYYSLSGATLPTGITFNTTTGVFSGTTTATFGPLIFTVTVYGSGGSATTQVTITCTNGPIFSYTTPDVYTQGTAITALTPTVTSGAPIISYAVSGTPLPTGLTLNTSTGVISGTPAAVSPATNYSIIGTNATGSTTVIINITVLLGKPVISYPSPQTYVVGAAITALNPTNTGGAATSYAISGTALPAGLTLNTSTGVISGTPTTATAVFAYTVTATNAAGTASCTVTITIVSNPVFTYTTPDVYTVGTAITTLSPTNTGSTPTSYAINTPLPAGLNFNTANGQITGTPTAPAGGANYIITGTDALGHTGTFTINITVNDVPPTISYTSPDVYTVGTTITPLVPTVTGLGAAPSNYIISGLPAGLSIDPLTGIISGTPTTATALGVYTVTATNDGGSGTFPITITVKALGPVIAYTSPDIYPVNVAITPLTPVNSGSTPTSYAIAGGALPTGLSFSTTTGIISGTPTAVTAATIYTITATDASGNTGHALVTISCAAYDDWIGVTSTDWNTASNWSTGAVPTATGIAGIGVNQTFQRQPTVSANTSVGAIVIGTSSTVVNVPTVTTATAVVLTVSAGTLTVAGTITYQSDVNSTTALTATISGAGNVITSGINVNATTVHAATYTQTLISSVTSLKISSDIVLTSTKPGAVAFNSTFNITGGTVTLTGKVQTSNASGNTSTLAILPATTATLQLANVAAFSGLSTIATATNNLDFDHTGATVEYSGTSQTVYTNTAAATGLPNGISNNYYSLKFSGTGIKTPNGTSADDIEVDGDFTNALTAVDATDYIDLSLPTIYFGGTTQSIYGGLGTTFYNVEFFGTGTTTIVSGFVFVASSGVLTMANIFGTPPVLASNGNLTLNSDASGSATIAAIPTGSSITGDVNVERFITGGAGHRGYRLLSAPVTVGATGLVNLNYLINSCYIKGTTGVPGGFDAVGNPNIYLFRENLAPSNASFISGNYRGINTLYAGNETSGAVLTNTNYLVDGDAGTWTVPKGVGYLFFFRGDRSVASIAVEQGLNYVPTNTTLVATGTLNQGAITVHDWYTPASATLGYTTATANSGVRGFNLVGNPYASSIDFDTFDSNTLTAGIYGPGVGPYSYIFDALSQNYSVYTAGTGGVGTIATVDANIIPSGQGFFVVAGLAGASLTFNEAAKVNTQATAANGNLFLGTPAPAAIAQSLHIRLTRDSTTSQVNTDGIFIVFNNSASAKYVPMEDAPYKGGSGTVSLTSMSSDSIPLAVNRMPFPTLETQKVHLTVKASASGLYQLNLTPSKSIPTLYTMWLKDAYKQDSLDIRANPIYSFNIDKSDSASFGANRFSLVMSENPALMVHLLNFNATKTTGGSQVVWKTENEQNYTNFTVERSTDGGVTFAVLGGYASSAQGTYSFLDGNPAMKANQYRLKIQDLNGTISYSKVITLIYGNGDSPLKPQMNVYPNPSADVINVSIPSSTVSGSQTNLSGLQTLATTPGLVSTTSGSTSSYDIKIISITGSVIKSATSASTNWQGSVSGLAPGTYIIQVVNNSDKSLVGRNTFVKL